MKDFNTEGSEKPLEKNSFRSSCGLSFAPSSFLLPHSELCVLCVETDFLYLCASLRVRHPSAIMFCRMTEFSYEYDSREYVSQGSEAGPRFTSHQSQVTSHDSQRSPC